MANWIAVASAEHVRRGVEGGFMQVCHGKAGPLRRIKPGDGVAYYSPSETFGGTDRLQAFTAIGRVREGDPYLFDMGGGFRPYRRNVAWADPTVAPIRPLLETLEFATGNANWGYRLRFGVLEIGERDFGVIAGTMGAAASFRAAPPGQGRHFWRFAEGARLANHTRLVSEPDSQANGEDQRQSRFHGVALLSRTRVPDEGDQPKNEGQQPWRQGWVEPSAPREDAKEQGERPSLEFHFVEHHVNERDRARKLRNQHGCKDELCSIFLSKPPLQEPEHNRERHCHDERQLSPEGLLEVVRAVRRGPYCSGKEGSDRRHHECEQGDQAMMQARSLPARRGETPNGGSAAR
jgi:hypothetical protein